MRFSFSTQPAEFLERPNRFRIVARLLADGQVVHAHCPNPGRMHELLIPGVTVHLSRASGRHRKTGYDLRFVEHPEHGQLISLDTQLPNALFAEGLDQGFFPAFQDVRSYRAETSLPHPADHGVTSRIDFQLVDNQGQIVWVEVKSVTLVEKRHAWFPDAPTSRGRRHVAELAHLAGSGYRAAVVFIVQRPDAGRLSPNWKTDPDFAQALVAARRKGVELYACTCDLTIQAIWLKQEIPVILEPEGTL